MDTRTVVSIVPAVMQAAQLRGNAVMDAAAFGAAALRTAVWRASTVPLEHGPAAMVLGICICIAAPLLLAVFHVALARSEWAELPWSRRVFVASCTKDLLNAVTATPCALAALCGLLLSRPDTSLSCAETATGAAGESSLMALKMPALALIACGITCGFFAADCAVLWRHGDELSAEMGRSNTQLMWPHHVLSLAVWPYCVVCGKGGIFVLYFISTEISSIFLNLHVLATKGGMDLLGPRTELLCAGLLFLTFALWRIVPIPVVLYAYRSALSGAGGCGLRAAERWLMALTVPIPLGLNLYFFRSLLKKAMRTYATTSPSKAKGG